jgi:hypothetical protein
MISLDMLHLKMAAAVELAAAGSHDTEKQYSSLNNPTS